MGIGLIIIGDEILSGKRRDAHFSKVVELLAARGLQLAWAQYLGDDPALITATLKRSFAGEDIVFSCGGIGATPDDHTRACAAAALGLPLVLHPEGRRNIEERTRELAAEKGEVADLETPENLHRLKMAEFPAGASLIPNPYNKIAGFSVGDHHFVPGFPVMAWPMIEWVLDHRYRELFNTQARVEQSVLVFDAAESALTPLMERLEARYPLVKVFSLPSVRTPASRAFIELGVKGEPGQTAAAFADMVSELGALKAEFTPA